MRYRHALPLLICCLHLPATADTVVVSSGERLGGKILHKGKDTLTLDTEYAGKIEIHWNKVVSIETDEPVAIQVGDEDPLRHTRLQGGDAQVIALVPEDSAEAAEAIPLSSIRYINPRPEETADGIAYKGRANLSLANTSGNNDNNALHGETAFNARARKYRYDLNAQGHRTENAGIVTSSNWLLSGNYDRYLNPKRFIYARTSVENDRFKDIDRRYVIGAGYGLQLRDTEHTQWSVRGGVDYVMADRISTGRENYPALGWGVKFSHRLQSLSAELFHEQEGYLRMNNSGQVTLRTRSGVRVPLLENITATAQINADWERRPANGRKSTDSTQLLGLGYEW